MAKKKKASCYYHEQKEVPTGQFFFAEFSMANFFWTTPNWSVKFDHGTQRHTVIPINTNNIAVENPYLKLKSQVLMAR